MTDARLPGRDRHHAEPRGSFGGIASGSARGARTRAATGATEPTPAALRAARRRWASGVAVVTTLERDGEEIALRGATMSSFQALSLEPPLVSLAVEQGSRIERWISAAGVYAVSILDRAHEFLSDRFSGYGPAPDARFTGIPHDLAVTGCPVLRGALAWFDCEVTQLVEAGDHLLAIGAVRAVGLGADTDDPLLNYEGTYRRLEGQ